MLYRRDVDGGYFPAESTDLLQELRRRFRIRRGRRIGSCEEAALYLSAQLAGFEREVFAVLFLDPANRVIAFERLFYGTQQACTVHMRDVIGRALAHDAAAVIVGHNHPGGVCVPSKGDLQITFDLVHTLSLVDVRVLDHIVVSDGEAPVSLRERGLFEGRAEYYCGVDPAETE